MKTWRSIVKTARTVMSSRLFVCLMALCLAVNTIPTASVAEALEGVTGEPTSEEVVLTDETTGDETAPDPAEQPTPEPEERPAAEPADEVAPPTDEAAPVEETAAPVQQAPEEGAAPAEETAPTSAGALTAKSGKATVTASFGEGTFEGPVTLHVEEIVPGDARFSQVEGSLDELAEARDDYSYSHARAFDIWFENEAGTRVEPAGDVSVSIDLGEPVSENAISTDVVHIPDNGEAELVADADVAADGSAAAFESDAFSVYVVTADDPTSGAVVGDQTFTTLAEAVEAASDGDTINIIGKTADEGPVAVNKSVTIYSDGADGSLPNGIDANGGTITLGGGKNTLTMGAVWATSSDATTLNIEDGVHITGGLPLYLKNESATLNIHGGKIEQTQVRENWNTAVGVYDGVINEITGGEIVGLGDGIYCYSTIKSISGGTITAGEYGMYLGWCTVESISGGTINAIDAGIYRGFGSLCDKGLA